MTKKKKANAALSFFLSPRGEVPLKSPHHKKSPKPQGPIGTPYISQRNPIEEKIKPLLQLTAQQPFLGRFYPLHPGVCIPSNALSVFHPPSPWSTERGGACTVLCSCGVSLDRRGYGGARFAKGRKGEGLEGGVRGLLCR